MISFHDIATWSTIAVFFANHILCEIAVTNDASHHYTLVSTMIYYMSVYIINWQEDVSMYQIDIQRILLKINFSNSLTWRLQKEVILTAICYTTVDRWLHLETGCSKVLFTLICMLVNGLDCVCFGVVPLHAKSLKYPVVRIIHSILQ